MNPELLLELLAAFERPHRFGMIGGDLEEQLAHCASFSSVLAQVARGSALRCADLGTGGGLPGVALATLDPESTWTLIDMRAGRAAEVERTVLALGLQDRVSVYVGPAQTVGHDPTHREGYDVVVARAFAAPSVTAECAAGLVAVGGVVVVSEPPPGPKTVDRWNHEGLEHLGLSAPQFVADTGHHFAVMTKTDQVDGRFPRLPPRPSRGWP